MAQGTRSSQGSQTSGALSHPFLFSQLCHIFQHNFLGLLFFVCHCQVLSVGIKEDGKSVGSSWGQGQEFWDVWLKPSRGFICWDDHWWISAGYPISKTNYCGLFFFFSDIHILIQDTKTPWLVAKQNMIPPHLINRITGHFTSPLCVSLFQDTLQNVFC